MDISAFVEKYGSLFIKSKFCVDGLYQGKYRSLTSGYSVEFTEHRPYEFGDDIRFVDWKVYARTDRFVVKKFTEETEMDAYILVDTSGSMAYEDKFSNTILLAGVLIYLFHLQKDRVSLYTTSGFFTPPTRKDDELNAMFSHLEHVKPEGVFNPEEIFFNFSSSIRKRGFVIILSDFLFDIGYMEKFLTFMHKMHRSVVGFWMLSEKEETFPFRIGAYFESIEDKEKMKIDPQVEKKVYLKGLHKHGSILKQIFARTSNRIIHPEGKNRVEDALSKFLGGIG